MLVTNSISRTLLFNVCNTHFIISAKWEWSRKLVTGTETLELLGHASSDWLAPQVRTRSFWRRGAIRTSSHQQNTWEHRKVSRTRYLPRDSHEGLCDAPHRSKICTATVADVDVCWELWELERTEPSLSRTVSEDESWCYGYHPEMKQRTNRQKPFQSFSSIIVE